MQKLILLIDDDKDEFEILNMAIQLARLPHLCIWAESSDRAEVLLQQVLPDLIFIDYNMPKVNGLMCLKRLRQLAKLDNTEIILYSNSISDVSRELALTQHASYFQKPFFLNDLVNYLKTITTSNTVM